MKYNQPLDQPSNPDAPYVDINPATGTPGSIVGAHSIEYDQREITAVIQYAHDHGLLDQNNAPCQNPSNSDLTQLLKAIYGLSRRATVVVPFTFYVNSSTGSDTNDGLTVGTPFKTIQHAIDIISQYSPGPNAISIQLADGSYGPFVLPDYAIPVVYLNGNVSFPSNVVIEGGIGPAITVGRYTTLHISNLKVQATGGSVAAGPGSSGIWTKAFGTANVDTGVVFGRCDFDCILTGAYGSTVVTASTSTVGSTGTTFVDASGTINFVPGITINYVNPITFSLAHFHALGPTGSISVPGSTVFAGAGVTGKKFDASYNAFISTGTGNVGFLPGTIAGTQTNGGQYN